MKASDASDGCYFQSAALTTTAFDFSTQPEQLPALIPLLQLSLL
jgi:hypothetical protein